MWLLESDGRLEEGEAPLFEIAGDQKLADDSADASELHAQPALTIRFGGTQDGRGFSQARRLRFDGYGGRIVAAGPLEPDQARHAFQSGFDAVAIEDATLARHGRDAWAGALSTSVTAAYVSDPTTRLGAPQRDIWHRRHNIA